MRVMIDTNVLLDALANREPYVTASSAILMAAAKGEIDLLISASAITDCEVLCKGMNSKIDSYRLRQPNPDGRRYVSRAFHASPPSIFLK